LAVLLLAFVLLAAVGSITRFYTDLLWFREIDKTQLFWGQIAAKTTLGLLAGLGTAIVIGANLWLVERLSPRYGLSGAAAGRPQGERYPALPRPGDRSTVCRPVADLPALAQRRVLPRGRRPVRA